MYDVLQVNDVFQTGPHSADVEMKTSEKLEHGLRLNGKYFRGQKLSVSVNF